MFVNQTSMNIEISNVIINTHSTDDYISRILAMGLIWEPNVTYFLLGLAKGGILLDVGANIGYYSLISAHKYSHIYAFEPIHYNYELFEKSIQRNNFHNISLIKCCVGDKDGEDLSLSVLKYNYGATRNREKTSRFAMPGIDDAEVIVCKQVTLDTFVAQNNLDRIDMLKVDVEGFEKQVLDGFKKGLAGKLAATICIEFSANMLPAEELIAILEQLKSAGYTLFDIGLEESGTEIRPTKCDPITYIDFAKFVEGTQQTNILARRF